jgi:RNA polymerase sigma-70 factor (ECF subfamily)
MVDLHADLDQRTRPSFLGRLALVPADTQAWTEFAARYGRQVYRWCRRWNLQPADAEDVTQSVLLDVARAMKEFQYDPVRSFRAWLKTLTHHAWCDWLTARRKAGLAAGGDDHWNRLATLESRNDLIDLLEAEHRRGRFEAAAARVRTLVKPATWEAFRLVALEELSGAEVARRLGMSVGAVYIARCKVQKLLRGQADEIASDD